VHEYAAALWPEYRRAARAEKARLLDQAERLTGYHRKSLIRVLGRVERPPRRRSGRPATYGVEVRAALAGLWEASGRLGSKRLVPFLPELIDALERHGQLALPATLRRQLVAISPATVDRLLARERRRARPVPYVHRRAPSALQRAIPVRTFGEWDNVRPGAVQADLVLHCGSRPRGRYLTTLLVVDVATGWIDCQAVAGLGYHRVTSALHHLGRRWPVPIRELHTDNGGEFLNEALSGYCRTHQIRFTRGRASKKNDQAWVEQKNWATVRTFVGYDRYESPTAQLEMQRLYQLLAPYFNYFQPFRKLVDKRRHGARVTKRFDGAATPYRRLLGYQCLSRLDRRAQEQSYRSLSPITLRRQIEDRRVRLWKLVAAAADR
jgi:hypothetical protein